MAQEHAHEGIRSIPVLASRVGTDSALARAASSTEAGEEMRGSQLLHQMIPPDVAARALCYLLSPDGAWYGGDRFYITNGANVGLKAVNRVIRYAADERLCTVDELQRWTGVITRLGIMVNIELYTGQALREMNAGNPRKAVLTIERGIDYLERIPNSAQYKVELDQFAAALERARKEVEILDAEERAGAGCVLSEAVDRMLADDSESLIKAY